ncbi:MAG: response regulator, partial [Enterocloster asparagiformis]|nr:response regulator [Enterocloster asparagiformis]
MKNRILVVEDERIISDLICMNLEAAGYETRAVYDGDQAAGLLREQGQEAADLALVDIMLPGMDGFALMELFQGKHI